MLTFTLAISCLTTSNLPWNYLIHGPNIPCSYTILFSIASDFTSITSHIHKWVLFSLWLHLFFLELFLHWSPVAYWAPTDLVSSFQWAIFFTFSYCSWCFQGKSAEVVCHSLLQWTTFCQNPPIRPVHLGWPHTAWLSFIELGKALVHYDQIG